MYSVRFLNNGAQRQEDMDSLLAIDTIYASTEPIDGVETIEQGNMDTCTSWVEKNDKIYHLLVDDIKDEVVGYTSAIPLEEGVFERIVSGEISDMELEAKDIAQFQKGKSYDLLFMSLVVHPEHRGAGGKALSRGFVKNMKELQNTLGVSFNRSVTEVVSPHGEKAATQRLGAKEVGLSKLGYKIMVGTMDAYYQFDEQKNALQNKSAKPRTDISV